MIHRSQIEQARASSKDARACGRHWKGASALVLAAALWLIVGAVPALAGPPTHLHKPALDINGFNHACGVAVDSKGDVYASSEGKEVKVYDPSHAFLTSIEDPHEPCGLAVNSKGELFVSEGEGGKVVRFKPNAYPFAGTPTYGAREEIDTSGTVKGIAVDRADDRLYVAEGNRISSYGTDGHLGVDEVQTLGFNQASGGTFRLALPGGGGSGRNEVQRISRASFASYTLTFEGQATASLETNATAAEVKAALEALSTIGPGDVSVTGFPNRTKWVEFTGALAETDVPLIVGTGEVEVASLSDITSPIAYGVSVGSVEAALEALQGIGAGNIAVVAQGTEYRITFAGALAHTDVPGLAADPSGLTPDGSGFNPEANAGVSTEGFSGRIGEGSLTNATGVAAYTYSGGDRYVFAADDAASDQVKSFSGADIRALKLRQTIDGPKGEDFGFGAAGAYLAVDSGNGNPATKKCESPVDDQACTAGHLLVYDAMHEAVDEFEANGQFLDQISKTQLVEADSGFADAKPTALAIERSGGPNDGTIYLTSGAGPGAKLLAFGPLAAPSRPPLPELAQMLPTAKAVAVDSHGDVYVAAGPFVHVFDSDGEEIEVGPSGKGIETPESPRDLAVDSSGKVYTLTGKGAGDPSVHKVAYYTPDSYPPHSGTKYSSPVVVASGNSFKTPAAIGSIGLNPADDHLFIGSSDGQIVELDAAKNGSGVLNPCFACAQLSSGEIEDVEAHGAHGEVYVSQVYRGIEIVDASGSEVVAQIRGGGSPKGTFDRPGGIAVEQDNGHVLAFNPFREVAEEYDGAGAFVAQFGGFNNSVNSSHIAIDNSGGPGHNNTYIAYDVGTVGSVTLSAFGPLVYGEAPIAITGLASGLGGDSATLNGTVDPRGFTLEDCRFEYLLDAEYEENLDNEEVAFGGALNAPCVPGIDEIGHGNGAVPVQATLSGLDLTKRYRFRLFAKNKYGTSEGKAGLFGPPVLTPEQPLPILYGEATLRGKIDPSGLATEYRFDYGTSEAYDHSTPVGIVAAGDGFVEIQAPLIGLAEGTEYHFRLVAENEAGTTLGSDQEFKTLKRVENQSCLNTEYRTGLSAKLPDCRAYELVTPPETEGGVPRAGRNTNNRDFNNWLIAPRGTGAGESVAFFTRTLSGFEGSGESDGYRAQRGEGAHPAAGWTTEIAGPSYAQLGLDGTGLQDGVAADQLYWSFAIGGASEGGEETFPTGNYLRGPGGFTGSQCNPKPLQDRFELIGCGAGGTDPSAESRYISAGGAHVIFASKAHLQGNAPIEGTAALYDRPAGSNAAQVVSLLPGGITPGAGENATHLGATEDGSAVVFKIGGALYLHRGGETTEIAEGPNATFAGIAEDGKRVFYAGGGGSTPASLYACDVEAGPCVGGGGAPGLREIAPQSIFVNVSADGSHAFFTSEAVLDEAEEGQLNERNLYAWDGASTRFVTVLDPQDFVSFDGNGFMNMLAWTHAVGFGLETGLADSPTRSTPNGEGFVFQSHGQLTAYDSQGKSEVYLYRPAAASGERLTCVSCDPTNAPPSGEGQLLVASGEAGVTEKTTLVPNLTDDGRSVFFQSPDQLVPEDANKVDDVYEWKAPGAGEPACEQAEGCLALISSGQGDEASYLYGLSADGHDVFIETQERLVAADIPGSPSLYDARVEGGIPAKEEGEICHGDACQGQGSAPPALPAAASTGSSDGNVPPRPCAKGKRRVKGRCLAKHPKRHHRKARRRRGGHR